MPFIFNVREFVGKNSNLLPDVYMLDPWTQSNTGVFSLVAIARKRPVYYKTVLTALLDFSPSVEMAKGRHTVSIQYSLRTAFLGFLRCTHPLMTEVKFI